jgi:hypothetical protein
MDDEQIDDDVLNAGALLMRYGSTERVERALRDTQGMDSENAQDVVAEASLRLIASAPRELRQSFEAVVAYHRWNHLFEIAVSRNNMSEAMEAQKQLDKLIARVH